MATAGSGDVLSGVLAATCGWHNEDTTIATALAAFICGRAGELAEGEHGSISMIASDTVAAISKVIYELERTECDSV
jgi:NAD(P)H-hydrate epimerase